MWSAQTESSHEGRGNQIVSVVANTNVPGPIALLVLACQAYCQRFTHDRQIPRALEKPGLIVPVVPWR